MSIVRWGEDGSHVYIIGAGDGWECVGCDKPGAVLEYDLPNYRCSDLQPFFDHLQRHREDGDIVPEWVEDRLKKSNEENVDE